MHEQFGPLRYIPITAASGAGGNTTCSIQPPMDEAWEVYAIAAAHDDVARTIYWLLPDGIVGSWGTLYTEAAVTARHYFHRDVGCSAPIRLDNNCYLQYRVDAMAAGKAITVVVAARKKIGVLL